MDGGKTPHLWSSDALDNFKVGKDRTSFTADKCSIQLSEDGNSYIIKSSTNLKSIVSLKVTKAAPPFVIGKDGTTHYGKDLQKPWGSMRHSFWPRCTVEGSVLTKDGEIDLSGRAVYIHALQGMKPHHCGKRS
jgi:Svf1-like N-terminal lipocalin domain